MRPTLGGPRTALVLVACAVLLAAGGLSFQRRVTSSQIATGIEWRQESSDAVVASVEPGSRAAAAGVREGDRLERIDGRPVTGAVQASDSPWERPGKPMSYALRRDGRGVTVTIEPVVERAVPEAYLYLSIVALAFLLSGAVVAMRWSTVRGGTIYCALAASLYGLLIFSHSGRGDTIDWGIFWADVVAGALAPALLIHLALSLARRTPVSLRSTLLAAYAASLGLVAFSIWAVGLGGAHRFPDPVAVVAGTDRLQVAFLSISVLASASFLARSYQRSSSALHRSQARWVLWGLGVGLAPFVVVCGIPWVIGTSAPEWAQFLAVVPMLVVPASFSAALIRYRLHDLDLALRRGLVEVSAIVCVMAVYAISKVGLQYGLGGLVALSPSGLRYLAILVAAVAYPRVREWVKGGVDKAFWKKRYSYRSTLLDFGRELNAETDLPSIADGLEQRVCETLGIPQARVLVRTGWGALEAAGTIGRGEHVELDATTRERLDRDRYVVLDEGGLEALPWARYLFGMKVKDSLRAVLVAAERLPPEEPLSSEDRALLSTLSAHAAAAIEAARLMREVRQQAEHVERLQSRQERILESSTVGLLLMDGERRILAWNRALEGIYGLGRDRAIGQRIDGVFPLHLVRRIERELATSHPDHEVRIYRSTLVNCAGHRIVVNLSVSPVSQQEVRGDGARVVSFDDVTEREKLEEQLLRQDRLASLGLLAAGVAHEVNTPLTGISSYAQMLLEDLDSDDPRREILEKIEAQSARASAIANSLLDLAGPARGAFEEISLNDAVRDVLALFEPQLKGRSIRIETDLAPDLPIVRGHRGKMQQVLLNLLLNARDAVGSDGRIVVRTTHGGGRVQLEVVDDGVGIAEEDLPLIFDPFFTTKGRGRGTGLGLSITHGIVAEHDGGMTVESTPGESTRFRVELPSAHPARALA